MNRYETNVSPCKTPATISKKSVCLYLVRELLLACFYSAPLWLWQFLWGGHMLKVFAPSSLCVCSQMPCRNLGVASRLFPWTPSKIRLIVRNFDVDPFLQKTFWFFLRIFLISSSMRLSKSWVHLSWGKGGYSPFFHLSIVFWLYTALQYESCRSSNFIVFHSFGGISSSPVAFMFLIFFCTTSSSS